MVVVVGIVDVVQGCGRTASTALRLRPHITPEADNHLKNRAGTPPSVHLLRLSFKSQDPTYDRQYHFYLVLPNIQVDCQPMIIMVKPVTQRVHVSRPGHKLQAAHCAETPSSQTPQQ